MTVNQALVIGLAFAVLVTITGTDIVNNTTFLILLIITLVALARSGHYCCSNALNNQNLSLI